MEMKEFIETYNTEKLRIEKKFITTTLVNSLFDLYKKQFNQSAINLSICIHEISRVNTIRVLNNKERLV